MGSFTFFFLKSHTEATAMSNSLHVENLLLSKRKKKNRENYFLKPYLPSKMNACG